MTLPRTLNQAVADQPTKERHAKGSKIMRVLHKLQTERVVTNTELNRICFRYGGRLAELREEGYVILTERAGNGLYRYTYMGHRDDGVTS